MIKILIAITLTTLSLAAKATPSGALAAFDQFIFSDNETGLRKGKRSDSTIVIKDGHTIYERYERCFKPDTVHIMWSVSKTVTALMYGVAVKEGLVKLDQSICDFVSAAQPGQCDIKIRDLLQWTSSLNWNEEYERGDILKSSVIEMLYGDGRNDMAGFVLAQPLAAHYKPGEIWRYSSGDTLLASKILKKVFKVDDLRPLIKAKLFDPLGIQHWTWESDAAGTLGGAFYLFLAPRDLARIGQIFLGHGVVNGQILVPIDFIEFMNKSPDIFAVRRPADPNTKHVSGAHLWINRPAGDVKTPWPSAPEDTVMALGHWGQYLVVVPSQQLVAVRTADTRDDSFKTDDFVSEVMKFVAAGPHSEVKEPQVGACTDPNLTPPTTGAKKSSLDFWHPYKVYKTATMALSYIAKNFCSCLFVVNGPENRCRDYASIDQLKPKLEFDGATKTTKATFFNVFS